MLFQKRRVLKRYLALLLLGSAVASSGCHKSTSPTAPSTPGQTTYYVATNGSNGNAGTVESPWRDISYGASRLAAGDTLLVHAGIYDDAISDGLASGTSWTNKIRIAAYPGETVWLRPSSGRFVVHFDKTIQYVEFDGINMDGRSQTAYPFYLDSSGGADPNHIRLQNAEIIGLIGGGQVHDVILGGATGGNEFIHLTIHGGGNSNGCGTNCSGYGIYIGGPNNLVDGCNIYDTTSAGIHIYNGAGGSTSGNIIRNNRIHDITRSMDTRIWGILDAGSNTQIRDNVVYAIGTGSTIGAAIDIYTAQGTLVDSNMVYGNQPIGIYVESGARNTIVQNNISYGNTKDYADFGVNTTAPNNLIGVDPQVPR